MKFEVKLSMLFLVAFVAFAVAVAVVVVVVVRCLACSLIFSTYFVPSLLLLLVVVAVACKFKRLRQQTCIQQ